MIGSIQHITLSDALLTAGHAGARDIKKHVRQLVLLIAVIGLSFVPGAVMAQAQLGTDIYGEAAYDVLGSSVVLSADGKRMAIGAPGNDRNGFNSGHVRIYQWSGSSWSQLGDDIEGEAAYDVFGGSVSFSLDGERLAIGASGNDDNGFDSGHVRVYHWSGTAWAQLGGDIQGEATYDEFGSSVSLSPGGDRLAVGAPKNDGNGIDSGHVRVYAWSGNSWDQLGSDIDGEAPNDASGWSVSISASGQSLAIGAYKNDGNGIDSGHARIYSWSGSAWVQVGADIDGEDYADESGSSVSLSSDGYTLAVGAHKNDGTGIDSGHVRVYQWLDSAWTQAGADIDGETFGDNSGWSVSLSADARMLTIGAPNNDGGGINSGHARLYQWSGAAWTQVGADIDGVAFGDKAGWSVSLSSYANSLAIGAPLNINDNGVEAGQVRVFDVGLFSPFSMNAGLNDAWYNPKTSGQGIFITVLPVQGRVSLAWFTYDTELPPPDAVANLGDPGHRWFTALGPVTGAKATMQIEMASGGLFDTATEITRTDPPGSDGTILLTFYGCNSGTVEYDISSINQRGTVYIQRVAGDNIVLCEALDGD